MGSTAPLGNREAVATLAPGLSLPADGLGAHSGLLCAPLAWLGTLRAFNLATFLQLASGVDEETWLFHLKRGDYTAWFRDDIKDETLAAEDVR